MLLCSGYNCERACSCARVWTNIHNIKGNVENLSSFGSAHMYNDELGIPQYDEEYLCGKLGNYAMFIPMEGEDIEYVDSKITCDSCGFTMHIDIRKLNDIIFCPKCGRYGVTKESGDE